MAGPAELPELIQEFFAMAKQYLRQETLEPAKALGRTAGFSMAAGVAFALGALLLSVAGVRYLIEVLPGESGDRVWSGLGYVIASVVLLAVGGLVARWAAR